MSIITTRIYNNKAAQQVWGQTRSSIEWLEEMLAQQGFTKVAISRDERVIYAYFEVFDEYVVANVNNSVRASLSCLDDYNTMVSNSIHFTWKSFQ